MYVDKIGGAGVDSQNMNPIIEMRERNVNTADEAIPNQKDQNQDGIPIEKFDEFLDIFKRKLEKLKAIFNTEAEFSIDKETHTVVVKIKDKNTGEVIRQIPPEVMLRIAKTIDEFLGLLFDERV